MIFCLQLMFAKTLKDWVMNDIRGMVSKQPGLVYACLHVHYTSSYLIFVLST